MSTPQWTIGIKKASAWHTAVALGALDEVLIESESLSSAIPAMIEDAVVGRTFRQASMQGNVAGEGNIVLPARFDGLERQLELIYGNKTTVIDQAALRFTHTFLFKPSTIGFYATVVKDPKPIVDADLWEIPSLKYTSLEMGHTDGKLMATLACLFDRVLRTGQVNGATELAALTVPTEALLMIFNQLVFRIKEVTGSEGNLSGSDDINTTSAGLTLNRNLSGEHESGSNAGQIDEPDYNGLASGVINVNFSNYTAAVDAFVKDAQAVQGGREPKTYKIELEWTGKTLGTAAYKLVNRFAECTIDPATVANAGGPGQRVPLPMTFVVETPAATGNGTDWTWAVAGGDPIEAKLTNGQA